MTTSTMTPTAPPAIAARDLTRVYRVPERDAGLGAALRSLVRRRHRDVRAVDGISFSIAPGEVVGFLGPNGAGKTTTIKMLSGLVHPTSGEATVLGFTPSRRHPDFLRQMALVMGNRNQLAWDLPALDSYAVQQAMYGIPAAQFATTRDGFIQLLELEELVRKPVRNLSLGERMKVEIAGALLHRPQMLFLDEPTLGLDIGMQRRIRAFIKAYNQQVGATVLLTSHYMADVEALCDRVILIDKGRIQFDGALSALVARFAPQKRVSLTFSEGAGLRADDLAPFGTVVEWTGATAVLAVPRDQTAPVIARLLAEQPVIDLGIAEASIEDVIQQAFQDGAA
jgi:ABC-2 type transport system ATP-binding protein